MAEVWVSRGVVLANLDRDEEASAAFEKALSLNPTDADALINMGMSLDAMGDVEAARERFEEALEIAPHDSEGHFQLACLWMRDDEFQKALESL